MIVPFTSGDFNSGDSLKNYQHLKITKLLNDYK